MSEFVWRDEVKDQQTPDLTGLGQYMRFGRLPNRGTGNTLTEVVTGDDLIYVGGNLVWLGEGIQADDAAVYAECNDYPCTALDWDTDSFIYVFHGDTGNVGVGNNGFLINSSSSTSSFNFGTSYFDGANHSTFNFKYHWGGEGVVVFPQYTKTFVAVWDNPTKTLKVYCDGTLEHTYVSNRGHTNGETSTLIDTELLRNTNTDALFSMDALLVRDRPFTQDEIDLVCQNPYHLFEVEYAENNQNQLTLDGVSQSLSRPAWNPTALGFEWEFEFTALGDVLNLVGEDHATGLYLRRDDSGSLYAWYNNGRLYEQGAQYTFNPVVGQRYIIRCVVNADGSGEVYLDGVLVSSSTAGSISLGVTASQLTLGYTSYAPTAFSNVGLHHFSVTDYSDSTNDCHYSFDLPVGSAAAADLYGNGPDFTLVNGPIFESVKEFQSYTIADGKPNGEDYNTPQEWINDLIKSNVTYDDNLIIEGVINEDILNVGGLWIDFGYNKGGHYKLRGKHPLFDANAIKITNGQFGGGGGITGSFELSDVKLINDDGSSIANVKANVTFNNTLVLVKNRSTYMVTTGGGSKFINSVIAIFPNAQDGSYKPHLNFSSDVRNCIIYNETAYGNSGILYDADDCSVSNSIIANHRYSSGPITYSFGDLAEGDTNHNVDQATIKSWFNDTSDADPVNWDYRINETGQAALQGQGVSNTDVVDFAYYEVSAGINYELTPVYSEQLSETTTTSFVTSEAFSVIHSEQLGHTTTIDFTLDSDSINEINFTVIHSEQLSQSEIVDLATSESIVSVQSEQLSYTTTTDLSSLQKVQLVFSEQLSQTAVVSLQTAVGLALVSSEQLSQTAVVDLVNSRAISTVSSQQLSNTSTIELALFNQLHSVISEQQSETITIDLEAFSNVGAVFSEQLSDTSVAALTTFNENLRFNLDVDHIVIIKTTPKYSITNTTELLTPVITTPTYTIKET